MRGLFDNGTDEGDSSSRERSRLLVAGLRAEAEAPLTGTCSLELDRDREVSLTGKCLDLDRD